MSNEEIKIRKTCRGFDLIEFTDRYGNACSLQKSSIAFEDEHIWFGAGETRMHIGQEQMKKLLPYIINFCLYGELTND